MTFHGIIPPVCTPMTPAGEVATDDLRRLIAFLLDEGVHGLFLLGSTSESIGLTDGQQETVIATGLEAAAGRVPVVVGCIDFTTRRVVDRALRAKAHGVDGIVACAPFYEKPDQAEIVRHFTAIKEAVDLPILAYDIPGAVQTKIERPTLATLAAEGVLSGLKDSSGQEANFRGVLLDTAAYPDFRVFTGSELMADVAMWLGAAGIVPGMGNVDPGGYVRLYDAAQAGDWATAQAEQTRLYRLFDIVHAGFGPGTGFSAAAWGSFKVALKLRGIITSATPTAPMSSLSPEAEAKIAAILKEAGLGAVSVAV
jgi:4-hydroxy-tetrahydrodipicolinate synthase